MELHILALLVMALCVRADQVAVVGSGVSGLTAALAVQDLGHAVTVFERESDINSLIKTLEIDDVVYDYLSVALCPIPEGSAGGKTALGQLAARFGHAYEPLPASENLLYFDSAAGITATPPPFVPYLSSTAGRQELLQQLIEGFELIRTLEQYPSTPQAAIMAGLALPNQTFGEWAAAANLPAFTESGALLLESAVSGNAENIAAGIELLLSEFYSPGLLRAAFLQAGVMAGSTVALEAGLEPLLGNASERYTFYSLPQGVHALFNDIVREARLDVRLNTPVTRVSTDGVVTTSKGQQKFDRVLVTVNADSAVKILPENLVDIYRQAHSGYNDAWLFNATFPANPLLDTLPFVGQSTIDGQTPGRLDGYPTYIVRVNGASPYLSAGGYVAPNVTREESTAVMIDALSMYGFDVLETVDYARVQYPNYLSFVPDIDRLGSIYILGETVAGLGINTNIASAMTKVQGWFEPSQSSQQAG